MKLKNIVVAILFLVAAYGLSARPKNVIFMIGDGMGFPHVKVASLYQYGEEGKLFFESFPHRGTVTTHPAGSDITDSAAASTAMATGKKVKKGTISMEIPGSGRELKTILEIYKESGAYTGIITTTYINHATPAGFAAHSESRTNYKDIARDYLEQTRPNVMLGGNKKSFWGSTFDFKRARALGYHTIDKRERLMSLRTEDTTYLAGVFGNGHFPFEKDGLGDLPHLSQMTRAGLMVLDNNPGGFFVMIEGGRIDHAAHRNDLERMIPETLEFEKSVKIAYEWVRKYPDTLLLVTADHETGGLEVLSSSGKGKIPVVSWGSHQHTSARVPVYAIGKDSEKFAGEMDNTDFFRKILD